MQINSQNLEFLFQQFDMRFQTAYEAQPTYYQEFATDMPSGSERNVYGWLAQQTGMRRWDGARQVNDVAARDYTLKNEDYEATIGLDRNKVEDDTYGVFAMSVDDLGSQGKLWPDDVMTTTLQAGTSVLCYDGQPYFDTDHPVDLDDATKGVNSNLIVGAAYDLAVADPLEPWRKVKALFAKFKGESLRPLNAIPDTIMVPTDLEKFGLQIANAQLTAQAVASAAAGVTNVYQGSIKVIVNPRLDNEPTVWYPMVTKRKIKPLLWQLRRAPTLVPRISPTDPVVFDQKKFLYGIDGRGIGGYSLPWLCARVSPS